MSTATERMEVRLTPEDKSLLLEAAGINHESASGFVVRAAREAAKEVIERDQATVVPAAFFEAMVASLDEPAQPITELASAVQKHRDIVKR
jgi:uncharacterized protein (DUF1778 family)